MKLYVRTPLHGNEFKVCNEITDEVIAVFFNQQEAIDYTLNTKQVENVFETVKKAVDIFFLFKINPIKDGFQVDLFSKTNTTFIKSVIINDNATVESIREKIFGKRKKRYRHDLRKRIMDIIPAGAKNIKVFFDSKESATYSVEQGEQEFECFLQYVLYFYNHHKTPNDVDFGITELSFVIYDLDGETHEVDVNWAHKAQYFQEVIDAAQKAQNA